jgi:hypothetical protein
MLLARPAIKLLVATVLLASSCLVAPACIAQQTDEDASVHELLVTDAGFIAIYSPKDWIRVEGRGLANFMPPDNDVHQHDDRIYINSAAVGPNEDSKDIDAYIDADIAGFRKVYPAATVERGDALDLPVVHRKASVVTFRSGAEKNAIERVVYVDDGDRVLLLVLSATNAAAFDWALPVFTAFAQSYRGAMTQAAK